MAQWSGVSRAHLARVRETLCLSSWASVYAGKGRRLFRHSAESGWRAMPLWRGFCTTMISRKEQGFAKASRRKTKARIRYGRSMRSRQIIGSKIV